MQESQFLSLAQEHPLEKEMATHSSILAWEIPWTEKPSRLLSMGSRKSRTWFNDWKHQCRRHLRQLCFCEVYMRKTGKCAVSNPHASEEEKLLHIVVAGSLQLAGSFFLTPCLQRWRSAARKAVSHCPSWSSWVSTWPLSSLQAFLS